MTTSELQALSIAYADITVPLHLLAGREHELLRSPPHLDHAQIVCRLVEIRELDPAQAGRYFVDVEHMSAAQVGAGVIYALNRILENRGHPFVTRQLQIVALNLKNLH